MSDSGLILKGEIRCWSFYGFKGLTIVPLRQKEVKKTSSLHFPSISVREIIEVIEKRASPKDNTSGTQLRSELDVA